jgi:phenylpyruvate tautomerase PptA (4-oxalocrotonate tautomerase family)
MKAQVLTGTKQEIAEAIVRINGEVREAIVIVEETPQPGEYQPGEDIFAEMEPFMVRVGGVDDSREAIYTRQEGE